MKARPRSAPELPGGAHSASPGKDAPVYSALNPLESWQTWFSRVEPRRAAEIRATDITPPSANSLQSLLKELLAGRSHALPVLPSEAALALTQAFDTAPALARALRTPDVCLWRRGPSRDLSTLVAEVLRQAVREGMRVLFLSSAPAPIERVLHLLAGDAGFLAVRFTAPGERATNGPLTRFSLSEQRQALHHRLTQLAPTSPNQDSRISRRQAEAEIWTALENDLRRLSELRSRHQETLHRCAQLAAEVRREADNPPDSQRGFPSGPFSAQIFLLLVQNRRHETELEKRLLHLNDRRESLHHAVASLEAKNRPWASLLTALDQGRWWTWNYWKARFNPILVQAERLREGQHAQARTDLDLVTAELEAITQELETSRESIEQEKSALIAAEIGRREHELHQQLELSRREIAEQEEAWRKLGLSIAEPNHRPAEPTASAVALAHARWQNQEPSGDSNHGLPLPGTDFRPEAVAGFLDRYPRLAPVLAGSVSALKSLPDFATAAQGTFDLLILDDADRLGEADLAFFALKATRCLLVGATEARDESANPFVKLWRLLHPTYPRPAYRWSRTNDRCTCTLRPLASAEERFVENERLADFPEIELRILSVPGTRPRLSQVVFPTSMSLPQAKSFIYRELQEAALDHVDRPAHLTESSASFTLSWNCGQEAGEMTVDLEPGLRESFCPDGADLTTCHLDFAKDAGWSLPKIHDWLRHYLGFLDTARTADLS